MSNRWSRFPYRPDIAALYQKWVPAMLKDLKQMRVGLDMADSDDDEIIERLKEIDEGDADISSWEADFLESIVYEKPEERPLTEGQREKALEIIEEYE